MNQNKCEDMYTYLNKCGTFDHVR